MGIPQPVWALWHSWRNPCRTMFSNTWSDHSFPHFSLPFVLSEKKPMSSLPAAHPKEAGPSTCPFRNAWPGLCASQLKDCSNTDNLTSCNFSHLHSPIWMRFKLLAVSKQKERETSDHLQSSFLYYMSDLQSWVAGWVPCLSLSWVLQLQGKKLKFCGTGKGTYSSVAKLPLNLLSTFKKNGCRPLRFLH